VGVPVGSAVSRTCFLCFPNRRAGFVPGALAKRVGEQDALGPPYPSPEIARMLGLAQSWPGLRVRVRVRVCAHV
jgi:hypothetical protein